MTPLFHDSDSRHWSAGTMACMGMSIFGALFMGGMALMLKNEYQ